MTASSPLFFGASKLTRRYHLECVCRSPLINSAWLQASKVRHHISEPDLTRLTKRARQLFENILNEAIPLDCIDIDRQLTTIAFRLTTKLGCNDESLHMDKEKRAFEKPSDTRVSTTQWGSVSSAPEFNRSATIWKAILNNCATSNLYYATLPVGIKRTVTYEYCTLSPKKLTAQPQTPWQTLS